MRFETLEPRAMLSWAWWNPSMSIAGASTPEGNVGQHNEVFQVTLNRSSSQTITALLKTSDGTAKAGSDYLSIHQTITFQPGQTSQKVSVPILGDTLIELDDAFYVTLSNPVHARLGNATATGTILNDDTNPLPPPPPVPLPTVGPQGPVGPQAGVVAPVGAIILSASSGTATNQSIINNAAAGATIFFNAGTYRDLNIQPKANQTYIGAYGTILTSTTQPYAFRDEANNINNVTVKNFVIDGYKPDIYNASLNGGPGWKILNNEVRNSATWGVGAYSGAIIDGNYIHHNHKAGLGPNGNNVTVTNNEVAFNNWLYEFDPRNEAGGSKFWACTNLLVANNNFHDNGGYGIWCDGNCWNVTIADNWVHNEGLSGIQYEISGQALIQGNLSENNGVNYFSTDWPDGDGIRVKTSHDVTVQYNIVRNNKNGIVGDSFAESGSFANNVFQDNTITMDQGTSGIWWDGQPASNPFPNGSKWIGNTYILRGSAAFAWSTGTNLTLAQWLALGND